MHPPAQAEEGERETVQPAARHAAAVAFAVIRRLGKPTDLLRVEVTCVREGQYRVNVRTGRDATSARVAHSFYVTANAQGEVLTSTPLIARVY